MKFYANMHTHSTHSDGGFSPRRLAEAAKEEGYGAVVLTDHDTVTGYDELKEACDELGLETIFGAEFSSPSALLADNSGQAATFHIVGYHFDPEHPVMKQYLEDMSIRETDQTRVLFERGVRLGKIHGISWDEVLEFNKGITWLCNDHLFRAMLHKGVITREDRGWFFQELFGVHRYEVPPCREFQQEYEIIQLIRDAGGMAILAHPYDQLQFVEPLMEMGLEGIEVWHRGLERRGQCEAALKLALEKNLYISGGSDHSGHCGGYYREVPEESPYYAPYLSYGTTKPYFDEIKNRQLNR